MEGFIESIKRQNSDFSPVTVEYLGRNYGTEYDSVLTIARQDARLAETLNADGEILAQVAYAARNEMALKLTDILFRRTGIGTLGHPGREVLAKVADIAAQELGWSAGRREADILEAEKVFKLPV